jgi:hypothetical protein
MIDYRYGHLARDSRERAISLLDALAFERAVDAAWTPPTTPANPLTNTNPAEHASENRRTLGGPRRREIVASLANRRS